MIRVLITGMIVVAGLASTGCKREIPVRVSVDPISGFRIEGTVSDVLGRPLRDLQVRLYYDDFRLERSGPEPSRSYSLQAPSEFVDVHVYNSVDVLVRTLFSGTVNDTALTVIWDEKLPDGSDAPSGKYTVKYLVGGAERASYVVLVYGTITTRTDPNGRFVIPNESLPLLQSQIPVYSVSNQFLGIYSIGLRVELEFLAAQSARSWFVDVEEGIVTRVDVIY